MLMLVVALAVLNLALVVVLLARRPAAATESPELRAKVEAVQEAVRQMRADAAQQAEASRREGAAAASELRTEVRGQFAEQSKLLASSMEGLGERLTKLTQEMTSQQERGRDVLYKNLTELRDKQSEHFEKINRENSKKLDEMRQTVDEKLQTTLQTRLTESFGAVTDQLTRVHAGLGEMKELATGVSDLKKVFSNVKSRGVVGEFMLGQLMEQMFSPEQYEQNARIKKNTLETVEYALKVPVSNDELSLLAIDSKFPQGDWERLQHSYDGGTAEEIAVAGKAFERAIRTEGKRICDKYIAEPETLPYAVMFLPTESLYAEVLRRPGLVTDLQQNCRVMITGPSTFMHMMANFRMGFRTIAIQKKGGEVWKVLGAARQEFEKFGGLMEKVERQVSTVQNTLGEIRSKTTTINRTLRDVEANGLDAATKAPVLPIDDFSTIVPLLAANEEE